MARLTRCLIALMIGLAGILAFGVGTSTALTNSCPARGVIAVGGYNNGDAQAFPDQFVDVKVHYSGALNDMQGGIDALAGAVNAYHAKCGATAPLTLAGHSQGAAIVHVYLSRFGLVNGNAVLVSDPKQIGTGESDHLFSFGGAPIAGTDANFKGVPTVSLCNRDDVICNDAAGWYGYFTGAHGRYDFNPHDFAGQTGIRWF